MRLDPVEDISQQLSLFYQKVIDWSKTISLARQALRAGDEAPSFLLPDENGRLVSSRELLESGPLILCFFLGSWSPYCIAELKILSAARPALRSHGAELVAVSHETGDLPRTLKRRQELDLTLLSDVDYGVGLSFGVVFNVPETLKTCLLKCGVDLPGRHSSASWILPMPATYVIDQSGIISAAFIYHDFTMRPDAGAIIEELRIMKTDSARIN